MNIRKIDYLTIPVTDYETSRRFYHEVLDLPIVDLPNGDGSAKLNEQYLDLKLVKQVTQPISFGLISNNSVIDVNSHLINYDVEIVAGPIEETRLGRKVTSFTILDPDKNKIVISVPDK